MEGRGKRLAGPPTRRVRPSSKLVRRMLLSRSARDEADAIPQGTVERSNEDVGDVALACRGDEQAFERLYRRHVARIRGLACRMAGVAAADELTQDAFVRAWERMRTFRG